MSKVYEEHMLKAPKSLRIAVFTASSSRFQKSIRGEAAEDESAEKAVSILKALGHDVSYLGVVDDDVDMIRRHLISAIDANFDVIVISGGTGLAKRDVTIEAVKPFLEKEMEGFGEALRMESFKVIGPPAALTRSVAGVFQGRLILALPGSPHAVETALTLFGRELPHIVYVARGQP